MKNRIAISLTDDENKALEYMSNEDLRYPPEQLRFLVRSEAERRGIWPIPSPRPAAGLEVRPCPG
jgi:hypothetical protein